VRLALASCLFALAACDGGPTTLGGAGGQAPVGGAGGTAGVGGTGGELPAGGAGGAAGAGGSTAGAGGQAGGGGADLSCPSPNPLDCSPGPGTGEADTCIDGTSCFLSNVKAAVLAQINGQPSWFDYQNPDNCPFILQIDLFMDGVVADLEAQGVCAIRDPNAPGEEVTVKHDNAYAENFDIVASNGCARYGDLIYTSTCIPAWW